jgi:hypothetical protein
LLEGLMRLQEKIRGQRIARQPTPDSGGWISHLWRRGTKVDDELPVPQQSGFVRIEDLQPVPERPTLQPGKDAVQG